MTMECFKFTSPLNLLNAFLAVLSHFVAKFSFLKFPFEILLSGFTKQIYEAVSQFATLSSIQQKAFPFAEH